MGGRGDFNMGLSRKSHGAEEHFNVLKGVIFLDATDMAIDTI